MPDTHIKKPRSNELRFVTGSVESFLDALATISPEEKQVSVWIVPSSRNAALVEEIRRRSDPRCIYHTAPAPTPEDDTTGFPANFVPDVVLLLESDPERLSAQLMGFVDVPDVLVIAPETAHLWSRRPLYLISIPKSGTHLLYELAKALGYWQGITCAHEAKPSHWYCIEYSNSHTIARDFFIDTMRRRPFGNRHHPFMRAPALFIYRNPLDVLVSEANYYHRPGKTSFAGYLNHRSFTERLEILLGNDWLLGSLRERIGGFIPWLNFDNVAAVSFEELVGDQGGGDDWIQSDAIWAIQLKLHAPGKPSDIAQKIFNRESPTFNEGRIGSFADKIPPRILRKFFRQPQDFMFDLGYARRPSIFRAALNRLLREIAPRLLAKLEVEKLPLHSASLRKKPLTCSGDSFDTTPILIETDFLGHNIIRLRNRFLGVPQDLGPIDLVEHFDSLPEKIISATSELRVKFRIAQRLNLQSPSRP